MLNHHFLNAFTNGIFENFLSAYWNFSIMCFVPCWQAFSPVSVSDTNEIVCPNPEIDAKDLPKVLDPLLNIPDLETNKYLSQCLKSVCYIAGKKSRRVGTVLKAQILSQLKSRCVPKHTV